MPEELNDLRERARRVERHGLTEHVRIDLNTYELLVEFVEAERCTLKEALRRAVRLGVQVLLSERLPLAQTQPWEEAVSSESAAPISFGLVAHTSGVQMQTIQQALETMPTFSEMRQADGSSDYTHTRPPGLV